MEVINWNDVKVYNLSTGKTLPESISKQKRRELLKNNFLLQNRIQLLQDFEMPCVSTCIRVSSSGEYILAAGTYRPRFRCYSVHELSMHFERCVDREIYAMEVLSDDYSKVALLCDNRWIEIHAKGAWLYKLRVPNIARDFSYLRSTCDLYVVGSSSEAYRLNLEQGRSFQSFETQAQSINCVENNPHHNLIIFGTAEGKVEAWDPRSRTQVAVLDCVLNSIEAGESRAIDSVPEVTALQFKGALNLGVGLSNGEVLLYDIRNSKPSVVKNHNNDLPIKKVLFSDQNDFVISMDSQLIKIWNRQNGKPHTTINPYGRLNDVCLYKDSGLFMIARDMPKMSAYYVPSVGPAPRWCSFLDSITEELEEAQHETVYDEYKFVTPEELEQLQMTHLIGTHALRAHMHGFYMNTRLYNRFKRKSQAVDFKEYQKTKVNEALRSERSARFQEACERKVPKVNRRLAEKLLEREMLLHENRRILRKKDRLPNPMKDPRFKEMFENPDFEVDPTSNQYRLLERIMERKEATTTKGISEVLPEVDTGIEAEPSTKNTAEIDSSDFSDDNEEEGANDDDDDVEDLEKVLQDRLDKFEVKALDGITTLQRESDTRARGLTLKERLRMPDVDQGFSHRVSGNMTMSFDPMEEKKERKYKAHSAAVAVHMRERKSLRRSTNQFKGHRKPFGSC